MTPTGTLAADRGRFRDWVSSTLGAREAHSLVLGGSLIMLLGTVLVSAVNFAYNVAMARMLGPAEFGHATAAVTLMFLASCITLSFQLVCAKFVALNETPGARFQVFRSLMRRSWVVGALVAFVLIVARDPISRFLQLPTEIALLPVLAIGLAFYVPLGVKRGGLQGACEFPLLTSNFVLEAVVKLVAAVLLVRAGYGVLGAVGALSVSIMAAYFLPPVGGRIGSGSDPHTPASFREGMQAIVFFVGQVIITNIDMVLVKHFFPPEQAGHYASIALVGRVLYFASWSVVSAMFPVSAASPREKNHAVLLVPMGIVTAISAGFTLVLWLFPEFIVRGIFGGEFAEAEPLLALYAAATGIYALSVVMIAYEMSRRIANTGWLQLAFSGALVLGITLFHDSLRQVVQVQVVLMLALLVAVSLPFLRAYRRDMGQPGRKQEVAA